MKKVLFCCISVLLIALLCLPLFSAADIEVKSSAYLLGDVDGNGEVDILDATMAQRLLAQLSQDDDGMMAIRGDVDGDGDLTSVDVTWIQRHLAFLGVPYPINTEIAEPTEAPTEAPTAAPTVRPTSKPDPYELPPI